MELSIGPAIPRQVVKFVALLRRECADASVTLRAPRVPGGDWNAIVQRRGERCSIYWNAARGFEIFTAGDAAGGLTMQVRQLTARAANSRVQIALSLAEIRQVIGASRESVAAALDVNMGSVSLLENRGDIEVRSLAMYIAALGGELELRAKFKDFEARIEPVARQ